MKQEMETTLPKDTCPFSLQSIDLTYSPDPSFYSYTWTPTETGWSFPGCRDGWHLSIRSSDLSVCIKVFLLDSNQNEAKDFCKKQDSVLIRVQTVEESHWMKKTVQSLVSSNQFFWIDGIRNCTGREEYCNNFDYSDGLTTGNAALTSDGNALLSFTSNGYIENCLIIMSNWESNATINDVQCVTEYSGMFCGYQLA
ncbi:hypothetical protein CAEBREN_00416 [Caenorhabditis brenneri]|uniref:C-type lectin domain-containing protein n=1 Tax=Caenorhabditis brenneri TaxID=135651 RepID=G0NSR7_CAEBE|nr:hypothetical protein CAEBREN_00416 [Caenorhabditis brenneri]